MVGGAVLTAEYAEQIGADRYAADAMASVRYAESIEETLPPEPPAGGTAGATA